MTDFGKLPAMGASRTSIMLGCNKSNPSGSRTLLYKRHLSRSAVTTKNSSEKRTKSDPFDHMYPFVDVQFSVVTAV